ncbi:cysteine-rich receptor-like protein kinase 25 isoform X2 [Vigna angularis]|uniref:cysteine-rich receptor-like protein kinase 25 isoform X2 n=1 Tax=Phaseolus angularis TaxID=3914 RepID=UPI0022B4233E|nr:cysteine-rich receptor-like protein kinase 25 isoform X2 [Vigna angularis]
MASYLKYVIPFIFSIIFNFSAIRAQGLSYQYQVCSTNKFTPNSTFQSHLTTLFSSLTSEASNNVQFFNNTITGIDSSYTVYGLFMCRGDIPSDMCNHCVGNGTQRLSADCALSKAAVVYYDECIVRYSNRSFFSNLTMQAGYALWNPTNMTNQESFKILLYDTMNKTADEAAHFPTGSKKFATRETSIDIFQKLYCLAQCTQDLSPGDCRSCLDSLINLDLPDCCAGSQGGRVYYPNCIIRFEIYPFFRSLSTAPTPSPAGLVPPTNSGENKRSQSRTITLIVVPIVSLATFVSLIYYVLRRRPRKLRKILLRKNFGEESSTLEGLQFDLATIKVATNNFSLENKIGKGGFGEVYKGILMDGRHIAVKRLSTSSRQGFCLEEEEKILIYEYVSNGGLDYFLFDFGLARIIDIEQNRVKTNRIVGTYGYICHVNMQCLDNSQKNQMFLVLELSFLRLLLVRKMEILTDQTKVKKA